MEVPDMDKSLMPHVEVIENGLPVSQERLDPAVAQFIFQAAMTSQLVKLRKLEESKVPVGSKSYEWTISDKLTEIRLGGRWLSFSLLNKSTSTGGVYCKVNEQEGPLTDEAPITVGETNSWDFEYPIIHTLFLQAESGTTAYIKVFGEVGRG